jgi:hypothetical protein
MDKDLKWGLCGIQTENDTLLLFINIFFAVTNGNQIYITLVPKQQKVLHGVLSKCISIAA